MKLAKKSRIAGVIAGATVFTLIGAGRGLSAATDMAQKIQDWRGRRAPKKGAET